MVNNMMSPDQEIVLSCAFRYALGRMTYVVDSVAGEIENNILDIPEKDLRRYRDEIDKAIKDSDSGMDMDVNRWLECKAVVVGELMRRRVE